ncbi:MAG: hypothetical protein KGJ80_10780 [Chloroflexota bacterium]|nr:hypothetical protein [Chloroflexota bacterium]
MNNAQTMNRTFAMIGDGALLIWWGISIMVGPITIGMSAIGTGLILLSVNLARWLKGIPTKGTTTAVGVIALVWGTFDHALALRFVPSFATLLIVIGVVVIGSLVTRPRTA